MKHQIIYDKSIVLLFVLFFITSQILTAQEGKTKNKVYGGAGYFMMGYSGLQLDELNESFKLEGIPELSTGSISFGGGGHYIFKNFILGGEGHGLAGASAENVNYKTSYSAGYGFFNLGYIIWQGKAINLYPILGLGGGGATASITEKTKLTNSFNAIIEDPARESYITSGGFLLNFSLGSDYFFAGSKSDDYTGGFLIGIKAGYILNVTDNDWNYHGNQLSNSPNSGLSGPYVRIVIGGGGIGISN